MHAHRLIPALIAAALAPGPMVSQEVPYTRHELSNGLTVILHPDRRLPLVAVNLWYHVGSKDEPAGRSGFAHLFEHLMFMGTEKVPYPQFDVRIEGQGGSNNASTSQDRTNYFEWGPSELLDTFLYLEADRMQGLGKAITQEKLDTQRGVVRNERRQRYENRPYGEAYLAIPRALYPPDHPYHHPVIGSHEDLESATLDDVRGFFDAFYTPRNASIVVAGDFEPDEALKLVQKHFGDLPAGPAVERPDVPPATLDEPTRERLEDEVELPLLTMVWHSPAFYQPGDAELDVAAFVLGSGKSSRLYRSLVYEKKLAQMVRVYQASRFLGSEFWVMVFARPGVSLEDVESAVDSEIERFQRDGPSPREVERARNAIEVAFWREIESVRDRADLLNRYEFYFGDPGAISRDRARYDVLTGETVTKWARQVLRPDSRLVVEVTPKNETPSRPADPSTEQPPSGSGEAEGGER